MKYYSTNKQNPLVSLKKAVMKGLAGDKGLFMPDSIDLLKDFVVGEMKDMTFTEISFTVAQALFGDDIELAALEKIVNDTLTFDTPVVHLHDNIYSLELFHGPTLAFKDVGARFLARLMSHYVNSEGVKNVNVLVATSGDTGSAVANGFLGMEGIQVFVLYPKGKVSPIQEVQFTTLGQNITALEVDGTFDDCQALVKEAFSDEDINRHLKLTSANSINIARMLPQSFYFFYAYAQLDKAGEADDLIVSVPCGNFGNLTAGLIAYWMGLPIKHFIAANNSNAVFYEYLRTGIYKPCASIPTIANAMDVGNPSNFARILDMFAIYPEAHGAIKKRISGFKYSNDEIMETMKNVYLRHKYILDPHGACAYQALIDYKPSKFGAGLFLETAHPAKFKTIVDSVLNCDIEIPQQLQSFINGEKKSIPMSRNFAALKEFLIDNIKI